MKYKKIVSTIIIGTAMVSTGTFAFADKGHGSKNPPHSTQMNKTNAPPDAGDISASVETSDQVMKGPTTIVGKKLKMPRMNAQRGKKLFVSKGCVACHAVNGIGGHDAPALDAHKMKRWMNPFDFAAKMWKGAPAMIAAQEGAFDEQVLFTGSELADIIAFAHDDKVQHTFTDKDLTAKAHKMMNHSHGEKKMDEDKHKM